MTLKNVSVIGNYQPRNHSSKKIRTNDGAEVENYYPAIISKEEFQITQALIERRKGIIGPRKGINNLFPNLITCEECGWNVAMNSARKDDYYWKRLTCSGYRKKKTDCEIKMNYDHFEDAMITAFITDIFDYIYKPSQSEGLKKAKADLVQKQSNLDNLKTQIDELINSGKSVSSMFNDKANELENEVRKLTSKLKSIPTKTEREYPLQKITSGEWDTLEMNLSNRAMVRDVLKSIILNIGIDFKENTIYAEHELSYAAISLGGKDGPWKKLGRTVIKLDYTSLDKGWHNYKDKYPAFV